MPDSLEGAGGKGRLARVRDRARSLVEDVSVVRRTVAELARVELVDRSLVIAAQALFSITPLLVVAAAFAPNRVGSSLLDQAAAVMGIDSTDISSLDDAARAQQLRSETGVIGVLLVVVTALSFGRAMQRLYERVWETPHRGGIASARRCMGWLVAWLLLLQLIAVALTAITGPGPSLFRLCLQIVASTGLWWWTAHTLLVGGVPWRSLWLGALLTSGGISLTVHLSQLFMPRYVEASIDQFGGVGLMFATSTWLFIVSGVLVTAAVLGRVLIEKPALRPSPGSSDD